MSDEEVRAAQTNAESAQAPEAPAETAAAAEDVNEVQFDGNGAEEPQKQTEEPRKEQSKAERAMHAQKRREAEQRAKELEDVKRQAKMEGLKEGLGGKNPYTDTPIEDDIDMQTYLTMKEIEKSGGDPVMDFAKYSANKRREEAKAAAEKAKETDWYAADRAEFRKAHPEVTDDALNELLQDETFSAFADKMVGKVPLKDIYESFNTMRGIFDGEANEKAERMYAKKLSSPASLGGTGNFVPKRRIEDIPDAEFESMIEKAKRGELKHI